MTLVTVPETTYIVAWHRTEVVDPMHLDASDLLVTVGYYNQNTGALLSTQTLRVTAGQGIFDDPSGAQLFAPPLTAAPTKMVNVQGSDTPDPTPTPDPSTGWVDGPAVGVNVLTMLDYLASSGAIAPR